MRSAAVALAMCSCLAVGGLTIAGASAQTNPPVNPFVPQSYWPEGHGTYAQQSTSFPAITERDRLAVDTLSLDGPQRGYTPSGTIYTEQYPTGEYVFWGTNGSLIYKVVRTPTELTLIPARKSQVNYGRGSGYWAMDRDRTMYFLDSTQDAILALRDRDPDDPYSDIVLHDRFDMPRDAWSGGPLRDRFLGIKVLYGGDLIFTTRRGTIGVVSRDFSQFSYIKLGERIRNNPTIDRDNIAYVQTSTHLKKYRWNGEQLQELWSVFVGNSGSAPTLVGVDSNEDRLIALTAGSQPPELLLLWRDEIPNNWNLPDRDPRVAGIEPITFGRSDYQDLGPMQNSLLVSGYGIFAARWNGVFPGLSPMKPGTQKFEWDPQERVLRSRWDNPNIYMPNSMQAMSRATDLIYGIGMRDVNGRRTWGLKGIDWNTGAPAFFHPLGPISDRRYNNNGSGVQIGPDGEIVTTSMNSVIRIRRERP
ncbi:MAG: hypothetical protein AAFX40_00610 [Cyanobacteria bacterium J06639_1]